MWPVFDAFLEILRTSVPGTIIYVSPNQLMIMVPNVGPAYSPVLSSADITTTALFLGMVAAIANERRISIA